MKRVALGPLTLGDVPPGAYRELTKGELRELSHRSDLAGFLILFFNWGFIAAIFATMAIWTNPLTIAVGMILLGGRQLGLAVIMHDCAHRSMFRTTAINDFVGQWLGERPSGSI